MKRIARIAGLVAVFALVFCAVEWIGLNNWTVGAAITWFSHTPPMEAVQRWMGVIGPDDEYSFMTGIVDISAVVLGIGAIWAVTLYTRLSQPYRAA